MPIFTVPIHEFNPCHNPAGSSEGGQFCSDTGQYFLPGMERKSTPYFPGFSRGAFEHDISEPGGRVTSVDDLVDHVSQGIAASLGVPAKDLKVKTVVPAEDIWEGGPGGYYAPDDPGNLHLTKHTREQVERFLMSSLRVGEPLEGGIAVLMHELLHAHSPAANDISDLKALESTPREWQVHRAAAGVLEEGLAAYLGIEMVRRVLPESGYGGKKLGYTLERAFIRRIERKAGPEFIRELWRQPSYTARMALLTKRFPKAKDLPQTAAVLQMMTKFGGLDTAMLKTMTSMIEAASVASEALWRSRIADARTLAALDAIAAQLRPRRASFSTGEQAAIMEQWALRRRELQRG